MSIIHKTELLRLRGWCKEHTVWGCSGMWCFGMRGFIILSLNPSPHVSFSCEVPTPSVVEGQYTTMFKPHIIKHRIPALPRFTA